MIDPAGNVVINKWEDCNVATCPVEELDTCVTIGGPAEGKKCKFPFTINGETYNDCITGKLETSCTETLLWGFFKIKTCQVSKKYSEFLVHFLLKFLAGGPGGKEMVLHGHDQ